MCADRCACGGHECQVRGQNEVGVKPACRVAQEGGGALPPFGGRGGRSDSLTQTSPGDSGNVHDHKADAFTSWGHQILRCPVHGDFLIAGPVVGARCPHCELIDGRQPILSTDEVAEKFPSFEEEIAKYGCAPRLNEKAPGVSLERLAQEPNPVPEDEITDCDHLPKFFACVTWLDACAEHGDFAIEDLGDAPCVIMQNAGVLVGETEAGVILARDYCATEAQGRDIMRIPRVCIKGILKFPPPDAGV